MSAFRDFLGDDEPSTEQLTAGARHALDNNLAEFIVIGEPAHSYVQLRYIWSAWHLTEVCWVEDVYVSSDHRGQRLGRRLMDFAIDRAEQRNCARLQLDANEGNEAGSALYRSLGFACANSWWDGQKDLYWQKSLA